MRALFTTQPGAGHWRPLMPLALALRAAGHPVAFATTALGCAAIERHGFPSFPMGTDEPSTPPARGTAPSPHSAPAQSPAVWVEQFAGRRAVASLPDLLAISRAWRPTLIVREITEFAGCVVAERIGIPHAAVQVSAFRPHLHHLIAPALTRLRATAGLTRDDPLAMLYRYLLLAPVPLTFQPPGVVLPPTIYSIRPMSHDRDLGGDAHLPPRIANLPPRPTISATLGTAYNRTPGLFAAILAALRDEPVNLIVTLGPGLDPTAFSAPLPNMVIEPYIPQSLLFPRCDLVITHGGFGTVMASLSHGLPLVIIPIAADMPDNARRCAELGVGRVIMPEDRTPAAIRYAIRAVLDNRDYRQNTERLQSEIKMLPGLPAAVSLLERLVNERRPVLVPSSDQRR